MAPLKSVVYVTLLIIYLHQLAPLVRASLYTPDDPVWELDSSNFQRIVLGKPNAWIIEFYSAWCGHCITFAPTWVEFANDIKSWGNAIEVGVVNCADLDNRQTCEDYNANSYPTIKLFPANINETVLGENLNGDRDVFSMRRTVIDYLETQISEGVPSTWPVLKPLGVEHLRNFWSEVYDSINEAFIFIEPSTSVVGKEIILDISENKNMVIRRVLTTNTPLIKELLNENISTLSAPLLIKIKRNGVKHILHRFTDIDNDTDIRNEVFEIITGHPRDVLVDLQLPDQLSKEQRLLSKRVHMADLENALYYSLKQEVGVHGRITGPKLFALKSFISALKMYFPGNATVVRFLTKLNNWITRRKGNITGDIFVNTINELQSDNEFPREMREWVGCKGSNSKFRGYPCSLWTLFHTLTVAAYDMYEDNPGGMKEDPHRVLFAIAGYVKYFFTCSECSKHFQQMAQNLEEELQSPQDTVLWLWTAHNKVNHRLSGDLTEDPQYPKIQFPSPEMCQKCRIEQESTDQNTLWDTKEVLKYLQHFYGKKNIVPVNRGSGTGSVHIRREGNIRNSIQRNRINSGDVMQDNPRGKGFQLLSETALLVALLSILKIYQDIWH